MPEGVVVVDDNEAYRRLVELALDGDSRFAFAGGAAEVEDGRRLALFEQPAVVMLDVVLGNSDGLAAVPAIREACPDAVIVLTSAYPGGLAGVGLPGGVAHLSKGSPPSELAAELDTLVGVLRRVETALRQATTQLPADLVSARAARRFLSTALDEWRCADVADTVTLLTSELVTNAVIHAGSDVEVDVTMTADRIRVSVTDRSTEAVRRRVASTDDVSGRGTELIDVLAMAWGVDWHPYGKTVWFEVSRGDGNGR